MLKNNSNIFERMMSFALEEGCKNANDLSKRLGYKSPEKLYRLERDATAKPSADILIDFSKIFENANMNWILTGIEPKYNSELTENINPYEEIEDNRVPYYDVKLTEINSLTAMEEKPDYFVSYKPFNDCTAYLPVYGDSMYPRYAAGDVIAVKKVKNKSIILWGEAYVVITNENANEIKAIKIIHEHADEKKVILRSSNPNYKGDIIIQKQDILSLYIIKGKITRNII